MASIDKVRTGYRARYRTPDGASRSKTFGRKVDAERFLAATEYSKAVGAWVDTRAGREVVASWVKKWSGTVRPTLKPKTFASYESLLESRILPRFGKRQLGGVRPSDVQAWIAAMQQEGLSASRIRQSVIVLRQVFDAAARDGMIGRNPVAGARVPKLEQREAPYFEPEIVERIAVEHPEPYDLLIRVLGTLGPRWGEVAALKRCHVDLLHRRLRIEGSLAEVGGQFVFGPTKSYAVRGLPLPPALATALERHLAERVEPDPNALVFTGPKGGPLRYRYVYMRLWRPALDRLGLPRVGLHVLRHSAAARMISVGASPKAVQVIHGHRSASFTLTVYGHLFDADLDALAARLDLPECVKSVSSAAQANAI